MFDVFSSRMARELENFALFLEMSYTFYEYDLASQIADNLISSPEYARKGPLASLEAAYAFFIDGVTADIEQMELEKKEFDDWNDDKTAEYNILIGTLLVTPGPNVNELAQLLAKKLRAFHEKIRRQAKDHERRIRRLRASAGRSRGGFKQLWIRLWYDACEVRNRLL